MVVFAAKVWSFWIAVALVISALGAVVMTGVMYYKKVVAPRYPKD
jgi:hypothetical protein